MEWKKMWVEKIACLEKQKCRQENDRSKADEVMHC